MGYTSLETHNNNIEKYKILCNKNYTRQEIAKELGICLKTVTDYGKETGIKPKRKVSMDDTYFENIDNEEKAYILGFIYADGYISTDKKALCIELNSKDIDILIKIKNLLKCKTEIRSYPQKDSVRLNVCSKKIVNDLYKLGVTKNKTKIIKLPLLRDDLYRHFFRGYCDGDGHIGFKRVNIVTGSENFYNDILYFLKNKFNEEINSRKEKNYWLIDLYRRNLSIIEWMYSDSKIYLDRKYNSYVENWVSYAEKKRTNG